MPGRLAEPYRKWMTPTTGPRRAAAGSGRYPTPWGPPRWAPPGWGSSRRGSPPSGSAGPGSSAVPGGAAGWPFGPPWAGRDGRPPWAWLVLPMIALAAFQLIGTYFAGRDQPDRTELDALGYTLLVAGPAVLVLRRNFPVPVLAAVATIVLGYLAIGYPYGPIFLSLVVAMFSAVLSGHRRAAWLTAGLAFAAYAALTSTVLPERGSVLLHLAGVLAWLLVVVGIAEMARIRRERFVVVARMHAEEGRRRASEERLGFARELHDVLAHNISLINVQAGVALHLIDTQPEQARDALAAIKDASKETLRELRATLGVLRQVDENAPRAPAPSLARLDDLIARVTAAGLTVRTQVTGTPMALPPRVDLAAYRIVQEALTNVYRHAGPVTATVLVSYTDDELVVQVDNDAAAHLSGSAGAATGAGTGQPAPGAGAGAGIAGMRERAESLGGELQAGPRPGGGFRVLARLPREETS